MDETIDPAGESHMSAHRVSCALNTMSYQKHSLSTRSWRRFWFMLSLFCNDLCFIPPRPLVEGKVYPFIEHTNIIYKNPKFFEEDFLINRMR